MRHLTKKQIKLLDNWFIKNKDKIGYHFSVEKAMQNDVFAVELFEEIEQINDFETLHAHIDNYLVEKLVNSK